MLSTVSVAPRGPVFGLGVALSNMDEFRAACFCPIRLLPAGDGGVWEQHQHIPTLGWNILHSRIGWGDQQSDRWPLFSGHSDEWALSNIFHGEFDFWSIGLEF